MTKTLGLVSCLMLAACGPKAPPAPPQPPPFEPAGYFEFITDAQGTAVSGAIEIRKSEGGGYAGTVSTSATDAMPIGAVTVEGQRMTLVSDTPDGPATLVLVFEGDVFTGSWSYAGMSGVLSGKRIR
jgi:hypothetical protein